MKGLNAIQISDLHICEKTRDQIIKNCIQLKSEISSLPLIICGDIFDKKTYCKGEDIEILYQIFDIFIDNLIFIIPGESDFQYGSPTNLLDNLKIERDNVVIITKNRKINIGGSAVLFLPPTDYDGITELDNDIYDYVVLYENNKSKMTDWLLNDTKYYLCGGIHEYKNYPITNGARFIYSGSFTRRFNETVRGYIKWTDGVPNYHKILNSDEIFCYYKTDKKIGELLLDRLNQSKNIKYIYVHFRKCSGLYMHETENKIRKLLENYPEISLEVSVIVKPHERIQNITNIPENTDFFSLDAQLNMIREKTIDSDMMEMHKKYYAKYMKSDNSDNRSWGLDKMYWSNLFCYRNENFLDFTDFVGLTTIIGKNGLGKTSLIDIITIGLYGLRSNGTDIPSNVCHTGFDKWNIVLYFSTYTQNNGDIKKDSYIIRRYGDNKKIDLSFYRIIDENTDNPNIINITKFSAEATQKSISDLIGRSHDFLNTNIVPQNNNPYVDRSPEDLTNSLLFSSYVNKFIEIEEDVKKTISLLRSEINKKTSEIKGAVTVSGDITNSQKALEKLLTEQHILTERLKVVEKNYSEIPKIKGDINRDYTELTVFYKDPANFSRHDISKISVLNEIIQRVKPDKPDYFLRHAERLILDIDNYEKTLSILHINPNDTESLFTKSKTNSDEKINEIINNSKTIIKNNLIDILSYKGLSKVDKTSAEYLSYKKYIDNEYKNNGKYDNITIYITEAIKLLGHEDGEEFNSEGFSEASCYDLSLFKYNNIINDLKFDDKCPCCIINKKRLEFDANKKSKLGMFIRVYLNCYYTDYITAQNNLILAEKIKFFKTIPDNVYYMIKKYKIWFQENNTNLTEINNYVDSIIKMTPTENYVIDYINNIGLEKYNMLLQQTSLEYEDLKKQNTKILIDINETKRSIENFTKVQKLNRERDELVLKRDRLERYLKLVQKDGICDDMLAVYLIKLNKTVNNILECITNFRVSIRLNKRNQLNIILVEKNINATQCSGGQKFIIDIAIRLSLLNIAKNRPKFMIIDEGFGSLDMDHLENIQKFMKLIDVFYTSQKNWILFVSHIDELKDISNNKISINTINNKSYISNVVPEVLGHNKKIILMLGESKSSYVPSIEDFGPVQDNQKYQCKYCKKEYTSGRLEKHLQSDVHKKNYIAFFSQIDTD